MSQPDLSLKNFKEKYPKTVFHLGLTMAGAVSAGAYSAGVISYLMQNLHEWQKKKDHNYDILYNAALKQIKPSESFDKAWFEKNLPLLEQDPHYDVRIPMHDVIIDVFGGASAGSLVAAISIIALQYKQVEIKANNFLQHFSEDVNTEFAIKDEKSLQDLGLSGNLLYDSWVNLSHQKSDTGIHAKDVFQKLLTVDKTNEWSKPFALFNSAVLDQIKLHQLGQVYDIADAEKSNYQSIPFPDYVSPNLKAYFSFTSLRGIPFSVRFTDTTKTSSTEPLPAHRMKMHGCMAIFSRAENDQLAYSLDMSQKQNARFLIESAIASGSFPIGFPPRKITLSSQYINQFMNKRLENQANLVDLQLDSSHAFELAAVDGGTINNEPFVEVFSEISEVCRNKNLVPDAEGKLLEKPLSEITDHPAIILIDPFPNFEDPDAEYKYPRGLSDILNGLIGALRGQAMVKDLRVFQNTTDKNPLKMGMIFPSRRNGKGAKIKPALATSVLGGFGGFLCKEFRVHDFHLGMKNAQSFIQKYFHIPLKDKSKYYSFQNWDQNTPAYKLFSEDVDNEIRFPIIPDMARLSEDGNSLSPTKERNIRPAQYPVLHSDKLMTYTRPIRKRIYFLMERVLSRKMGDPAKPIWNNMTMFRRQWWATLLAVIFIIGTLVTLFCVLEPMVFWLLAVCTITAVFLLTYAAVYWMSAYIIRMIGNELKSTSQLFVPHGSHGRDHTSNG